MNSWIIADTPSCRISMCHACSDLHIEVGTMLFRMQRCHAESLLHQLRALEHRCGTCKSCTSLRRRHLALNIPGSPVHLVLTPRELRHMARAVASSLRVLALVHPHSDLQATSRN